MSERIIDDTEQDVIEKKKDILEEIDWLRKEKPEGWNGRLVALKEELKNQKKYKY